MITTLFHKFQIFFSPPALIYPVFFLEGATQAISNGIFFPESWKEKVLFLLNAEPVSEIRYFRFKRKSRLPITYSHILMEPLLVKGFSFWWEKRRRRTHGRRQCIEPGENGGVIRCSQVWFTTLLLGTYNIICTTSKPTYLPFWLPFSIWSVFTQYEWSDNGGFGTTNCSLMLIAL